MLVPWRCLVNAAGVSGVSPVTIMTVEPKDAGRVVLAGPAQLGFADKYPNAPYLMASLGLIYRNLIVTGTQGR